MRFRTAKPDAEAVSMYNFQIKILREVTLEES